jgi:uncharacterized protein YdeI (YjbR/CyaY-like superfamily)
MGEAVFFESAAQWRRWLERHHAEAAEILVGFHKKGTGRPTMTWGESVAEALCFGWIDGVRRSLGPEAYTIRFTPRRPGSHWSRVNVDLVARLETEGRMTDAGRAAYAARREDRTARFSYEQEAVALDAEQEADFRADPAAWSWFLPLVHGTPGRPGWRSAAGQVVADGDAAYGIALASRLPVRSWHVLHLGRARGRYPIMVPSSPPQVIWIHDEPRAALVAVLERPRITVVATHLSFVPGVNVAQLRRLRRALTQLPGPHVVVGDLNLPGRLPARVTGWRPLVTGPTFPSPAPRLQIDHVLTDDLSAGTERDARIVHLPLSDHRAVTVDLALQDELVP